MLNTKPEKEVRNILAEYIGVDPEDINLEDSLADDLHMSASDITDFVQTLESKGFDISSLDLATFETFEDLVEALGSKEYVG